MSSNTPVKRVISHPDEVGGISKKIMSSHDDDVARDLASDGSVPSSGAATPPAIVECDDVMEEPRQRLQSSASTSSSLSDQSGEERDAKEDTGVNRDDVAPNGQDDDDDNQVEGGGLRRNEAATLIRADSSASSSSQRSAARSAGAGSGTWGYFLDVHGAESGVVDKEPSLKKESSDSQELLNDIKSKERVIDISQPHNEAAAAAMAVTAPNYVLEESLSSQKLWKHTAGNRPPQPEEERAYYEMLWRQNFAMSQVDYNVPEDVLAAGTPISYSPFCDNPYADRQFSNYNLASPDSMATETEVAEAIERLHGYTGGPKGVDPRAKPEVVNKKIKGTGSKEDLTVLIRGDNVFGTTVSKSFDRVSPSGNREVDTVNISIASYRVVESKKHGKFAQFLVIYREGSIRDTIGVWKRYSDFEALTHKVVEHHDSCSSVLANMSPLAVTEEPDVEHLPNAITSWRLLKKRQRWFRCLDAGYLSLKVFLLERFLHDILFESTSPKLLRDFVVYETTK